MHLDLLVGPLQQMSAGRLKELGHFFNLCVLSRGCRSVPYYSSRTAGSFMGNRIAVYQVHGKPEAFFAQVPAYEISCRGLETDYFLRSSQAGGLQRTKPLPNNLHACIGEVYRVLLTFKLPAWIRPKQ